MDQKPATPKVYGLMAEFDDPNSLVEAARKAYAEGYRKMDTYSPFPIEPAWEALGVHDRPVSFFVLCGGIVGMIGGFGLCSASQRLAYSWNSSCSWLSCYMFLGLPGPGVIPDRERGRQLEITASRALESRVASRATRAQDALRGQLQGGSTKRWATKSDSARTLPSTCRRGGNTRCKELSSSR